MREKIDRAERRLSRWFAPAFLVCVVSVSMMVAARFHPAQAQWNGWSCGPSCVSCVVPSHLILDQIVDIVNDINAQHIRDEFDITRDWIFETIWEEYVLPSLQALTLEITAATEWQTLVFGAFFDAKTQMDTQRTLQELSLQALKDYQPSYQMCRLASVTRGLMFSEKNKEVEAQILNEHLLRRQTGSANIAGAEGEHQDLADRLEQFKGRFCDIRDNNDNLAILCPASFALSTQATNKDIDYAGVVERALTLDDVWIMDLANSSGPPSTSLPGSPGTAVVPWGNVMALENNLYGHRTPLRLPETVFHEPEHQAKILDIRSIIAKRSVAAASFNEIVGMRAPGSGGAYLYTMPRMAQILQAIGLSTADFMRIYDRAPSYYAQMEFLTKKIFHDQQFFVNLYDKPANIGRQRVFLQAIGLMQDFDTLQSYLRTEVMLSVLLELELIKLQRQAQARIDQLKGRGT